MPVPYTKRRLPKMKIKPKGIPDHWPKCPVCGHRTEKLHDNGKWCIVCKLIAQGKTRK